MNPALNQVELEFLFPNKSVNQQANIFNQTVMIMLSQILFPINL